MPRMRRTAEESMKPARDAAFFVRLHQAEDSSLPIALAREIVD